MNSLSAKPSKNKGGRHLFEILSQVKDNILKRRYNLAWEMASKHYEQNKNSLTNEEIYQLCRQSCIAIEKKVYHRLTTRHKRSVAPVTNSHIQHLLSLQMSLHGIMLPELVKQDSSYFNMLYNQSQPFDPKTISQQDLVFQRKNQVYFLQSQSTQKQLKKLVKQHLKICNTVLMYKILHRKNTQQLIEIVNIVQNIFEHFQQHQFPSEIMDFQLIKLSIIQDIGIKDKIKCQYRLPLGFINKIHTLLKRGKEENIDYLLKKMASYLALSFRHLEVPIQEVFIGCSEAKYIAKIINSHHSSKKITKHTTQNGMRRLLTIDRQGMEEQYSRFSKKSTLLMSDGVTEKNIERKKKDNKGQNRLNDVANYALNVIEGYMNGRKQIREIIFRYFSLTELKRQINRETKEQFVENAIQLNCKLKNPKKQVENHQEDTQFKGNSQMKSKSNCLMTMLTRPRMRAKTTNFDNEQLDLQQLKMPIRNKSKGKFILRNIQMVKKPIKLQESYCQKITNLLKNLIEEQSNQPYLQSSSSDQEEDHAFQKQRRKKIQDFKLKLVEKNQIKRKSSSISSTAFNELTQTTNGTSEQTQKICLLDDVVANTVETLLKLPERSKVDSPLKRLQNLKNEVGQLNTERKLLVQSLNLRQSDTDKFMKENMDFFSKYKQNVKNDEKDEIDLVAEAFRKRVDEHAKTNKKLMNIFKEKDSFLPSKNDQGTGTEKKLKLEQRKRESKKLGEVTFQMIEQEYKKLEGKLADQLEDGMALRCQFDKLRRDVAKNQFLAQNEKKNKNERKSKYPTILEIPNEEEATQRI